MIIQGTSYKEGIKTIYIKNQPVEIYCDEDGYTTIQSRGQFGNPEDYFYRNWTNYLYPFGTPGEEFWLGLKNIYYITNQKLYSLKIEAEDVDGVTDQATWNNFRLTEDVSYLMLVYVS